MDGFAMVRSMAAEVQIMMQHKIDAIKRIMELAENIALDHKYDKVPSSHRLRLRQIIQQGRPYIHAQSTKK